MTAANTSRAAYRSVDHDMWFGRILAVMRENPDETFCIADLAAELHAEKSTISARLNEMHALGIIEYGEKKASRTTGIAAYHYKLRIQPGLL